MHCHVPKLMEICFLEMDERAIIIGKIVEFQLGVKPLTSVMLDRCSNHCIHLHSVIFFTEYNSCC